MGDRANDPEKSGEAVVVSVLPVTHVGASTSASSFPQGSVAPSKLAGRYAIQGLLGAGGMGSVYLARDEELDELVALKVLRPELVDAPHMLERFRREVKLARRVTHPNVARVFDIGEHEGGKFLTMEYVEGESLGSYIARTGRLSIERTIEIACAICAALGAAHKAGVVHRDLKPDNVMLAKDGRVVVTDFGIARALVDESGAAQTMGGFVGTPAYMAPEQVEGAKDVDARADIYAFGAVLYELFTGERPWTGDSPISVAAARLMQPPPDPRKRRHDLPTACAEVVLKCMARSRGERFADVGAIASELSMLTLPALPAAILNLGAKAPVATQARQPSSTVRTLATVGSATAAREDRAVAVLPFRNASAHQAGPHDDDYLAEELTDDLIDTLSMTPRLRVRSRGTVTPFRGKEVDAREVGRELGVEVVVEGSVRKAGGRVRITARVIGVADGFQLWAKRFDRPEQDVLAINDEVAQAIAGALTVSLDAPTRHAPTDPLAVELYLRARHEYRKFWPDPMRKAVGLFDEALARAPDDPLILAGAALARARLAFFVGEGLDAARQAAERATRVAPELGEGHLALASVLFQMGDTVLALREYKAAIKHNAGLAEAHASLGRVLLELGDLEGGARHCETALRLDPQVPLASGSLAKLSALLGKWDAVDAYVDASGASDGDVAGWTIRARMTLWRRDPALAARQLEEIKSLSGYAAVPQIILELTRDRKLPDKASFVDLATSPAGAIRRRIFFAQVEAETHGYLGHVVETLLAIDRSIDQGLIDLPWLERCPLFDAELRSAASFQRSLATLRARTAALLEGYRAT